MSPVRRLTLAVVAAAVSSSAAAQTETAPDLVGTWAREDAPTRRLVLRHDGEYLFKGPGETPVEIAGRWRLSGDTLYFAQPVIRLAGDTLRDPEAERAAEQIGDFARAVVIDGTRLTLTPLDRGAKPETYLRDQTPMPPAP